MICLKSINSLLQVDLWPYIFPRWQPQWLGLRMLVTWNCEDYVWKNCSVLYHNNTKYHNYLSRNMTKPTKWVCAQRRLNVRSMGSEGPKLSLCGQRRLWSDWADAQADLSLRWAHAHFIDFVISRLISFLQMQQSRILDPQYQQKQPPPDYHDQFDRTFKARLPRKLEHVVCRFTFVGGNLCKK